jgi:hypothetical protein
VEQRCRRQDAPERLPLGLLVRFGCAACGLISNEPATAASDPLGAFNRPYNPSADDGSSRDDPDRCAPAQYRHRLSHGIDGWIRANLPRFDVLEITLDHCLAGSKARAAIFDLVGQIPLTAHGIGLSIGTDAPLDVAHLDAIAVLLDRLKAPAYSEHLAFTRVPSRRMALLSVFSPPIIKSSSIRFLRRSGI